MKLCNHCKNEFPDHLTQCPEDGEKLISLSNQKIDPHLGQVLLEKYRIDKLLGKGGMGAVYGGVHLALDRQIAIKLMHADLFADESAKARFIREAKAAARLNHPNALTIHDFGTLPGGGAFIIMEYIQGKSLREHLSSPLPVHRALSWFKPICEVIEAAHRQEIIHRDLKPENIMLKESPEGIMVKVVDFGLAKISSTQSVQITPLTKPGEVMGTPYYMAPELFDGDMSGKPADIYALGIIFYEMITGQVPFSGSIQQIITSHLFKTVKPVSSYGLGIPTSFDEILAIALKKKPQERISSALEFYHLLNRCAVEKEAISTAATLIPQTLSPLEQSTMLASQPLTIKVSNDQELLTKLPTEKISAVKTAETPHLKTATVNTDPPRKYPMALILVIILLLFSGSIYSFRRWRQQHNGNLSPTLKQTPIANINKEAPVIEEKRLAPTPTKEKSTTQDGEQDNSVKSNANKRTPTNKPAIEKKQTFDQLPPEEKKKIIQKENITNPQELDKFIKEKRQELEKRRDEFLKKR